MNNRTERQTRPNNHKAPAASLHARMARYSSQGPTTPPKGSNKLKHDDLKLSKVDNWLSRVMHHQKLSDIFWIMDATLGRPSGLLGSALVFVVAGLLGPAIFGYLGYEYNYSVNIAGLFIGYVLGLVTELIYVLIKKIYRKA